ncbi:MAG TPA: hypothetical protein VF177_15940 [Anaerolineae bacterium]
MELLDRRELMRVVEYSGDICVSIYVPTHPAGLEWQEKDPLRLRNLLREAERQLSQAYPGLRVPDIQQLLQPAANLLREGSGFWKYQGQGLAIFLATDFSYVQHLPFTCEELVLVANNFYIRPLLPLFSGDGRFYILAFSQNQVQLFHASQGDLEEIELPDVPKSLAEALKYDDPEKQLQFRGASAPGAPGRQAAMFYSHGMPGTYKKDWLLRYCRQVDDGLQSHLRNQNAPLVLACVDYLFAIYQQANTYPYLWPEHVPGNPDRCRPGELHLAAWHLVQPHFQEKQRLALAQCWQLLNGGQACCDLAEIVAAAHYGRVATLFVASEGQQSGSFNPQTGEVQLLPHSEPNPNSPELLNLAAIHTILNGGAVYAVPPDEVPGNGMVAAIFRY